MHIPGVGARDTVVLVDPAGAVLGQAPKLAAHQAPGHLHLAFSVVLYDADGGVLLQQRAADKYHFPLYWANACCSHPGPGEDIAESAERRVHEELGLTAALSFAGTFVYRATDPGSGLVEHELDHVFVGEMTAVAEPDPAEVAALAVVDPEEIFSARFDGLIVPWLGQALRLAERLRAA